MWLAAIRLSAKIMVVLNATRLVGYMILKELTVDTVVPLEKIAHRTTYKNLCSITQLDLLFSQF